MIERLKKEMRDLKPKKVLLLGFKREDFKEVEDIVLFHRHKTMQRRTDRYHNFCGYIDSIVNIYNNDGVFTDHLIKYIYHGKQEKIKSDYLINCYGLLTNRVSELFEHMHGVIFIINKDNHIYIDKYKDTIGKITGVKKIIIDTKETKNYFKNVRFTAINK